MSTYNGTLPTLLSGLIAPGSDWAEIVNALHAIADARSTYVPAWSSAGTQPAIGNGAVAGQYLRVGKFWVVSIQLTAGSTTTYGTGQYYLSLPPGLTAAKAWATGSCRLLDSGTANKSGTVFVFSTLDKVAMCQNTADVTATTPHTMATGDQIEVDIVVEGI